MKKLSSNAAARATETPRKEPPKRTAEEQALVDAWKRRPRIEKPPKFKGATTTDDTPGTVLELSTNDREVWLTQLLKAVGISDSELAMQIATQASECVCDKNAEKKYNVGFAGIHSIGPRDGIEAMLAAQMVGTHHAAMEMLGRAVRDQPSIEVLDSVVNRATKLLRVYALQVEALNRYRNAGKQQIFVQYVGITADQAAVAIGGTTSAAAGLGGGIIETGGQPHAKRLAHASVAPVRSPDKEADAMSVASNGERPLPDAWRQEPRRAKRESKRPI